MNNNRFRKLFRQRFFVMLVLLVQIILLLYIVLNGSKTSHHIGLILRILSFIVVINVIGKKDIGSYKLAWVILILLFPIFGGLLYLMFYIQRKTGAFHKSFASAEHDCKKYCRISESRYEKACIAVPEHINNLRYLDKTVGYPVFSHTRTKYLSPGEEKFKHLIAELKKAEKYIFLEYFIICEGEMWNSILKILKKKLKQGVDIRVIYDDMGCFFILPKDYPKKLEAMGIKCEVFNPFVPILNAVQNNRDHRKIVSIDGKVAFTGGINLADEYINAVEKHGHWKDASVMLEGEAAWSMTVMFLQMWSALRNTHEDVNSYYPWRENSCSITDDGFVQPYADSPADTENVCEQVYLHIIGTAKEYLYINTPYLIIDDSLASAVCMAAKSGVDVRITTPCKGDKWYVHMTTRSYYRDLILSGVKIYEYSSGFIHSKTFVSDGTIAAVGTANLDFRSLYLNFECGVCMYGSAAVNEVYSDYVNTLKTCKEIRLEDCSISKYKIVGNTVRLIQEILRLFAPLM